MLFFRKRKFDKFQLFIFLLSVFFLPYTQWGIPFGSFKFTLSDLFIVLNFLLIILRNDYLFPYRYSFFLLWTFLFINILFFSIFNAVNLLFFFKALLPWLYALILLFVTGWIQQRNIATFNEKFVKVALLTIIISAIPAYLNTFGIIKINQCYYHAKHGFTTQLDYYRYSFFTTNPNQYAAFVITIFSAISLMVYRYFYSYKNYLVLLLLFLSIGLFATGSKTSFIVLGLSICYLSIISFISINFKKKIGIIIISIVLMFSSVNMLKKYLSTSKSFSRAVLVLDLVNNNSSSNRQGLDVRYKQFQVGNSMFHKYPVLGTGLGNFVEYHEHEMHNTFLSILFEAGLLGGIGLLLYILMVLFYVLNSKNYWSFKMLSIFLFIMFILMNISHIYIRERWSWLFISILILSNIDIKTNIQSTRLKFKLGNS